MMLQTWRLSTLLGFFTVLMLFAPIAQAEDSLADAEKLYWRGRYAEALEKFAKLTEAHPVETALGTARCQLATGDRPAALKTLAEAAKQHAEEVALHAMMAQAAFDGGDHPAAKKHVAAALKIEQDNPAANWVQAELQRTSGKLDEALATYEKLLDYYNENYDSIKDPAVLRTIGMGAAQHARWTQNHDQFDFLVSELYPDAIKLGENYWPASLESGRLFLEKFNAPEAKKDFQAALKINPNAAEVHAALAELALQTADLETAKTALDQAFKINPKLLLAHELRSDLELAKFEPAAAAKILQDALPLNPVSETLLGRLAAAQACEDGLRKPLEESRLGKLIEQVKQRNPKPGMFYRSIGQSLDALRHYPESAHYYLEASRVMPQLVDVPGLLGWVYMRLGKEDEAKKYLEQAFEVNFGNERVTNGLAVLEVLDTYETIESEHFLIRFDPKQDEILARYVSEYLEELYPDLCKRLGYFPKEKSLFEIFNRAKNTDGHGWFSARMVGLPHIHTIGACGGQMVAIVSPGAMPKQYNWARVVRHEFVHMVNLQQTNFNIPHWYTEALAVHNEGFPRSSEWNAMLARRVPAGKVFNLETINQGFIRPTSSEDWQMAYCQAELYADYLLAKYGDQALAKMLSGYADNLSTPKTIKREFDVTVEEFEKGYTEYVKKIVQGMSAGTPQATTALPELEKLVEAEPENVEAAIQLALHSLDQKDYPRAGRLAKKALSLDPKNQGAIYIQVRLQRLIGNHDGAMEKLQKAMDAESPHPRLLRLLAKLKFAEKDYDEAVRLYELGRKKFPSDVLWSKLLARTYDKAGKPEKLTQVLVDLADADADDFKLRARLAKMALEAKDYPTAASWAKQAMHVDVMNGDVHAILWKALVEQKQYDQGIRELEVAAELKAKDLSVRMTLARAYEQAGNKEKARDVLKKVLKTKPDHKKAAEMLKKLSPES